MKVNIKMLIWVILFLSVIFLIYRLAFAKKKTKKSIDVPKIKVATSVKTPSMNLPKVSMIPSDGLSTTASIPSVKASQ